MSIDAFFGRRYDRRTYNCAHFVIDVWAHLTGDNIAHIMRGFLLPADSRYVRMDLRRSFVKLETPVEPCIVLMQRRRNAPHVGVWIGGKVFHLHENGVELQPIEVVSIPFHKIGYYKCLNV